MHFITYCRLFHEQPPTTYRMLFDNLRVVGKSNGRTYRRPEHDNSWVELGTQVRDVRHCAYMEGIAIINPNSAADQQFRVGHCRINRSQNNARLTLSGTIKKLSYAALLPVFAASVYRYCGID